MERIEDIDYKPTDIGTDSPRKSIEERLADLEACCKENKIFIFKLMSKATTVQPTPYELSFILNNLDFYI